MNKRVSTLAPLDASIGDPTSLHRESVSDVSSLSDGRCNCSKCGIYRWYPPLMLLSTVLAGVFCWMYVTKPVFLTQPSGAVPAEAQPAFQEVDRAQEAELTDPPTAAARSGLDPAGAGLPGDTADLLENHLVASAVLSNDLRPLRVDREGPPLFQPLVVSLEQPEGAVPVEENSAMGEGDNTDEESVGGVAHQSNLVEESSDAEDYRVQASFMAEFAAASDSAKAAGDGEDAPKN